MKIPSFNKILGISTEKDIEKRALKKKIEKEMMKLSKLILLRKCTLSDLSGFELLNKIYLKEYGTDEEMIRFEMKMNKLRKHINIK